jgi:hypothetical protein
MFILLPLATRRSIKWYGLSMWRLISGFAVGGWLCCFQWLLPALADDANPCSIQQSLAGQLFPNNSLATRLSSTGNESFFKVTCSAKSSGTLRLTIDGTNTKAYAGLVQFRLVSANGIFGSATSEFTSDVLNVPYSLSDVSRVGEVMYQVQISAPDRQMLQAARDYSVAVRAELLP